VEFVQAFVYGNFTDAAANLALERVSATSFAAQFPPKAVTLAKPVADSTALKLSWTTSTEKDFANYRVFRSLTSPVDSTAAALTIINDNAATTYRDAGVAPNTNYFYRVFVYDRSGLFAGSNEVQGQLKK
jgi:chitodextrinase